MPVPPEYLTIRETCAVLRRSARTVRRFIAAGKLRAMKLPGAGNLLPTRQSGVLVTRNSVETLLEPKNPTRDAEWRLQAALLACA